MANPTETTRHGIARVYQCSKSGKFGIGAEVEADTAEAMRITLTIGDERITLYAEDAEELFGLMATVTDWHHARLYDARNRRPL